MQHRMLVAAVTAVLAVSAPADRPNVLFIISDDLTAEAVSAYGNVQAQTPHIDRLAETGVRFNRAYCQYPVCGPSRASMMSGLYPLSIGVMGNGQSEEFTENLGGRPSLAELFKKNGYYTARMGKIYHMRVPGDITAGVDGPDHAASWTERFNCPGPEWMSNGEHAHLSNEPLDRTPDKHYGLGFGGAFYVVKGDTDGAEQPDVQAADRAIALMRAHRENPFFLAVGLVRPHVPLVAPAAYFDAFPADAMALPPAIAGDWEDIPRSGITKNSAGSGLDTAEKKRQVLSAYHAAVAFMDAQVGRILGELDALGLREKTIVVFTSDHGYHLGEHEFWQKMSLREESARIPLIVAAPGVKPAVTESLAQLMDLYPTLAELGGLAVPPHCEGKSLAPVLADPAAEVHGAVYTCMRNDHLLTAPRWSYIVYGGGGEELYDLKKDPRQFFNLAGAPAYGNVLEEMRRMLSEKRAGMGSPN
ncbi:MAG: sulfatase [Candidatus Hydrogenedentes bacterium]|nr:sulfatase [Candidatus Hydrogenedentota bacterium]